MEFTSTKRKKHIFKCLVILLIVLLIWLIYDRLRILVPTQIILETQLNQEDLKNNVLDSLMTEIPRKFVTISINLEAEKSFYLFNLPMVCLSWRRVGFEPIVLVISSSLSKGNILMNKTIEYLNLLNIKIVNVRSPANYETMISMLSRLFIGLVSDELVSKNDFIITSDSDLYPVDMNYYNIENNNIIKAWNAFCCGTFKYKSIDYEMYPISHIGMKKWQWQQVMKVSNLNYNLDGVSILKYISETYNQSVYIKTNDNISRGDAVWYLDQTLISINIKNYLNENNNSKLDKIPYRGIRLDRAMSKQTWMRTLLTNYDSITDCHSYHSDVLDNWSLLQPLILKLFNRKLKILFDKYYFEYKEIFQKLEQYNLE